MSKKRHKDRIDKVEKCTCQNCKNKANASNPFGMNPMQLMSLFGGGMDFSKLGTILSSMRTDGFDLNNMNLGPMMNSVGSTVKEPKGGIDMNELKNMLSKMDVNVGRDLDGENQEYGMDDDFQDDSENDDNIEMLLAIKNIVDDKKAQFIDRVIRAYKDGDIN